MSNILDSDLEPRSSRCSTPRYEYLISSRARDLTERVTADLESVGLAPTLSRPLPGAEYLSVLADTVESLLGRLDVEGAGQGFKRFRPGNSAWSVIRYRRM